MTKAWLFLPAAIAIVAVALFVGIGTSPAPVAQADAGPHSLTANNKVTADTCPACHRLHTAQQAFLLKDAGTETEFCFSCHDGTGSSLNAQDGVTSTFEGATAGEPLRGGGFTNAVIKTNDPADFGIGYLSAPAPVTSRHNVDGTGLTVWGYGLAANATVTAVNAYGYDGFDLLCTNCHDPHGNGNYRILRALPKGLPFTGSHGAPAPIATVVLADQTTKDYTVCDSTSFGRPSAMPNQCNYFDTWQSGNYTLQEFYNESVPYGGQPFRAVAAVSTRGPNTNISEWCSTCHTRYLREDDNSQGTSSGDAIFNYQHRSQGHPGTGAVSNTPISGTPASNVAGNEVCGGQCHLTCVTCHVAHGTNAVASGNAANQAFPDGSTAVAGTAVVGTANNTRLLKMDNRGICLKGCHGASGGNHALFGGLTPVP